jgi:hypothetical protein
LAMSLACAATAAHAGKDELSSLMTVLTHEDCG